jgi:hypothetical protein
MLKSIFKIKVLALSVALAFSVVSQPAYSAPSCVSVFKKKAAVFNIRENRAYGNSKFTVEQIRIINSYLQSKNLGQVRGKEIADVASQLVAIFELSSHPAEKSADMIGEIAMAVYPKLSNANKRRKMQAMSSLAESISHFESYKVADSTASDTLAMVTKDTRFLRLQDMQPYIESYIKQDGGDYWTQIPDWGQGILDFKDIRDTASHNLWVLEYKGHDIRHAHFLLGHPYATNAYFRAARSKNADRYTIMAGLFEGVDTAQYGWESRITSHFDERGMTLEEAMLYVGTMPKAKIEELKSELGFASAYSDYGNAYQAYSSFTPRHHANFPREGVSGKGLNADLKEVMEYSYDLLRDPSKKWLTNYAVEPPKGGSRTTSDESIQHY